MAHLVRKALLALRVLLDRLGTLAAKARWVPQAHQAHAAPRRII